MNPKNIIERFLESEKDASQFLKEELAFPGKKLKDELEAFFREYNVKTDKAQKGDFSSFIYEADLQDLTGNIVPGEVQFVINSPQSWDDYPEIQEQKAFYDFIMTTHENDRFTNHFFDEMNDFLKSIKKDFGDAFPVDFFPTILEEIDRIINDWREN